MWVITHNYRRHERKVAKEAIFMDVGRGPVTIVTESDPAVWLAWEAKRWEALEKNRNIVGDAKTDILITFAVKTA